jgi:hypothetical protein
LSASQRFSPLPRLQAEKFKASATTSINTVEQAVGNTNVDLSELRKARTLMADAQTNLEAAESSTRDATEAFNGVIIFIGVCAILCAILGLLCVFVRVRTSSPCFIYM